MPRARASTAARSSAVSPASRAAFRWSSVRTASSPRRRSALITGRERVAATAHDDSGEPPRRRSRGPGRCRPPSLRCARRAAPRTATMSNSARLRPRPTAGRRPAAPRGPPGPAAPGTGGHRAAARPPPATTAPSAPVALITRSAPARAGRQASRSPCSAFVRSANGRARSSERFKMRIDPMPRRRRCVTASAAICPLPPRRRRAPRDRPAPPPRGRPRAPRTRRAPRRATSRCARVVRFEPRPGTDR